MGVKVRIAVFHARFRDICSNGTPGRIYGCMHWPLRPHGDADCAAAPAPFVRLDSADSGAENVARFALAWCHYCALISLFSQAASNDRGQSYENVYIQACSEFYVVMACAMKRWCRRATQACCALFTGAGEMVTCSGDSVLMD